jgi:hypothetical protein
MWVKGALLHFIVDNGSQKNLISIEVVKRLDLPTTPHMQPYTIGWLRQVRDLCVSQQCRMPYGIKPFKDEVLCDISPLQVCDVLFGQPYLWKRHVVYESRPHSIIITLGRQLYRIPEIAPPTTISLISAKQCSKVISQTRKFVFFFICAHSKQKRCLHICGLYIEPLFVAEVSGRDHGRIHRHLLLTHQGTDALPSEASN